MFVSATTHRRSLHRLHSSTSVDEAESLEFATSVPHHVAFAGDLALSPSLPRLGGVKAVPSSPKKTEIRIKPTDFELLCIVGTGAYGRVLQVRHRETGKFHAMKVIDKKLLVRKKCARYTREERNILTQVDHPFIVHMDYAFQTEKKVYIVMDFVRGGELFWHIRRLGLFHEEQARVYVAEVVLAVEHLHSLNIIHRYIALEVGRGLNN